MKSDVHDMGGVEGFGAIDTDPDAPLFYHDWEKKVLALALAMGATGTWNLDESRHARETLPEDFYLNAGYYRIWLRALERLLVKHALVSSEELSKSEMLSEPRKISRVLKAENVNAVLAAGSPVSRQSTTKAIFKLGDQVRMSNQAIPGHTRLPGYIRGHVGIIARVHGCHVFPDSHAAGAGEDPKWLYTVRFDRETLWSKQKDAKSRYTNDQVEAAAVNVRPFTVSVDCWEPYLVRVSE